MHAQRVGLFQDVDEEEMLRQAIALSMEEHKEVKEEQSDAKNLSGCNK